MVERVVILNTYSWYQKGDAAIVLGTVAALRVINPGIAVAIVSTTPDVDEAPFNAEGIEVLGGPFRYLFRPTMPLALRTMLFMLHAIALVAGLCLASVARRITPAPSRAHATSTRTMIDRLAGADLVISCGGGFWTDHSRRAIYIHLFQVVCAAITRRPLVSLGVSLGPFVSRWRRWLVGRVLSLTRVVVLREEESLPVARAMRLNPAKVIVGADMAFLASWPEQTDRQPRDGDARLRIGVTARQRLFPLGVDPGDSQREYEAAIAGCLDALIAEQDAEVIFLPQVIGPGSNDDRIVQRRIRALLKEPQRAVTLEEDLAPQQLIALIGGLDLLIATRFHSAIFSLLAGTPVVAIAYEHKTTGIMNRMGLGRWVLPIDGLAAADLARRCAASIEEAAAIRAQIRRAVRFERVRGQDATQTCLHRAGVAAADNDTRLLAEA